MHLSLGGELESRRRRESESVVRSAAVQPHAGQIEWRLRPRFGQILRRERPEGARRLKLRRKVNRNEKIQRGGKQECPNCA
jgi:hypothetical protein